MSADDTTRGALSILFIIMVGVVLRFCFADVDRVEKERNQRADAVKKKRTACKCCHCTSKLEEEAEEERNRREYPGDCLLM